MKAKTTRIKPKKEKVYSKEQVKKLTLEAMEFGYNIDREEAWVSVNTEFPDWFMRNVK